RNRASGSPRSGLSAGLRAECWLSRVWPQLPRADLRTSLSTSRLWRSGVWRLSRLRSRTPRRSAAWLEARSQLWNLHTSLWLVHPLSRPCQLSPQSAEDSSADDHRSASRALLIVHITRPNVIQETPDGAPQPPPPGVSIFRRSPGWTSTRTAP